MVRYSFLFHIKNCIIKCIYFIDSYRSMETDDKESELLEPAVPKLTSLGRSLSSIEIAPLWAEMVGVVWPRDPLQRVEVEEGLKFKLEWKMLWCDDQESNRVNSIAFNPQDRVQFRLHYS